MPSVTVSFRELQQMVGTSQDKLREALILNKLEIDDEHGDEWKLEATPDRPDLFSVEGIARQLRAWMGISAGLHEYPVAPARLTLEVGVSKRPCVAAGIVRNVTLDDATVRSLFSLQELLDLTLGRGRKKAAIGIHDMDQIVPPVVYKDQNATTTRFIPLDGSDMNLATVLTSHPKGKAYAHLLSGTAYPVFTDQKGVISFAPIINSHRTRVTPQTKNLFIEMQGSDQQTLDHMLNIMVTALADRGGTIEGVRLVCAGGETIMPDLEPRPMTLPPALAASTLGLSFTPNELARLLERMGYAVAHHKDTLEVLAPAYRADLLHTVDIVEDVAIAYGYNAFVPELPKLPVSGSADPLEERCARVRLAMVGLGFTETLNFSLTSSEKLAKSGLPADGICVENPVSLEYTHLRQQLLPGLLENLAANTRRRYPQRLFEVADVVVSDPSCETRARNVRTLCACISHATTDLSEITSAVRALTETVGLHVTLENAVHPSLLPGRAGRILCRGVPVGFFGEVHPRILANWGLKNPVTVLEMVVD